jgi:CheY-like chemotaxis protein
MSLKVREASRRILLADDDPVTRSLLSDVIQQEGYTAISARDGREAYRILQADADFSGAIFDMMMPNLDSLEVIRYMRTERRLMRIPVMVMTSQQDLKFTVASFAAGASLFLPKPFTPVQFERTLRILLNNRSVAA